MAEQSEQRQRYGYTDESGNRVSALRDMFNGGGPGQSGTTFQGGGALSSLGNALGGPAMFGGGDGVNMGRVAGGAIGGMALGPVGGLLGGLVGGGMGRGGWGYTDAMGNRVSAGTDMIDGGGRGMAGDTFQGGPFSGLLNAFGIRPLGYNARQAAMQQDANAPSLMAPATAPAATSVAPPAQLDTAPANSAYSLTQQNIQLLQTIGLALDAMPGEPATQQEIDALGRYPTPMGAPMSAQPGLLSPPASTAATTDPRLLPIQTPNIADLEAYLSGQPTAMATSPMLSVPAISGSPIRPMPDFAVLRPHVSRSTGRIPPMQGFLPVKTDIRPPPPAPPGMNLPVNPGAAEANRAYIEMLRRAAERGNPIRPAASILPR